MPLFSVSGPPIEDVKVTFENVCAMLNDDKYLNGIDRDSVVTLLSDIYSYVGGNRSIPLHCPAPVDNPSDRFGFMWPEGAKVSSRPTSRSSSHRSRHVPALSSKYVSKSTGSRTPSVTSSAYSGRYIGIVDEEPPVSYRYPADVPVSPTVQRGLGLDTPTRRYSKSHIPPLNPSGGIDEELSKAFGAFSVRETSSTLPVPDAVIRPTKSLQQIYGDEHNEKDDMEGDVDAPRQERPVARKHVRKTHNVGIADE